MAFQRLQVSKCLDFSIHFSHASTATEMGSSIFFRGMTPGYVFQIFLPPSPQARFPLGDFFRLKRHGIFKIEQILFSSNRELIRPKKKSLRAKIVPQWKTGFFDISVHCEISSYDTNIDIWNHISIFAIQLHINQLQILEIHQQIQTNVCSQTSQYSMTFLFPIRIRNDL